MQTTCINIFGGPGIGKSTFAAELFVAMKKKHILTELTTEYAKDLIWQDRPNMLNNQISVLGEQWDRIQRLVDKVQYIINDSPTLLSSIYAPEEYPKSFHELVLWTHKKNKRLNLILPRHEEEYEAFGRIQNEKTAKNIDIKILNLLKRENESYFLVPNTNSRIEQTLNYILNS